MQQKLSFHANKLHRNAVRIEQPQRVLGSKSKPLRHIESARMRDDGVVPHVVQHRFNRIAVLRDETRALAVVKRHVTQRAQLRHQLYRRHHRMFSFGARHKLPVADEPVRRLRGASQKSQRADKNKPAFHPHSLKLPTTKASSLSTLHFQLSTGYLPYLCSRKFSQWYSYKT